MNQLKPSPLHPAWLNAIYDPAMYPHIVSQIELLETHISWVILTGEWAYKLKKPVNFGFVDFTTLELRHVACQEELRLNRRTAPLLYDGVVPLTTDDDGPCFGGSGTAVEYAVRMRQFAQRDLLENCLARNELTIEMVDLLARQVADLHRRAAVAGRETSYGEPDLIREMVQACFDHLSDNPLSDAQRKSLARLKEWMTGEGDRLSARFVQRKQQHWVRECHGDLHLGNLVLFRGKPTLFDCLEFNPQLRWIDVFSDIAFLVMDLHDRDQTELAWRVLNQWLEQTGDYEGLYVLRYYLAYRALVRAKVAALRLQQSELTTGEEQHQHELLESYLGLASRLARPTQPAIVLMNGVSGSGKSFVARHLASRLEAVQIRSDVERKRLSGIGPSSAQSTLSPAVMYTDSVNAQTYLRLETLVRSIVGAGYPVIVDATFLKSADRKRFIALAGELKVPLAIVACTASAEVLRERIDQRSRLGQDPSDADSKVLRHQLVTAEPLDSSELLSSVAVDSSRDDISDAADQVRKRIRGSLATA